MQTKMITVRTIRKSDVKQVCKMIKALAAHFGDKVKVTEGDLLTHCFGRKKISEIMLAFNGNEPAGYAISREWMNFNVGFKILHIDALYVAEPYRRLGAGTAITRFIAIRATKSGCRRITLGVGKQNKLAMKLYKKLGFQSYGNNFDSLRLPHEGMIALAKSKGRAK